MSILQTELRTEHLTIAPGGQKLIEDLNWRVAPSEFWCILGQNGVGKTSLLYALAGLEPAASGSILLDGQPVVDWPAQELAVKRAYMPQQQLDHVSGSVLSTVLGEHMPGSGGGNRDSEADVAAAQTALAAVGLTHKADMDILTLSAGERQRVALAAVLAHDPAVMLLDEPVVHQNASQQIAMMRFIRELAGSHAVVSSCHDIDLAARFATHVLVLAEKKHWLGPADEVLTVDILQQAFDCNFEMKVSSGVRSFIPY